MQLKECTPSLWDNGLKDMSSNEYYNGKQSLLLR